MSETMAIAPGTHDELEQFRTELTGYCYRMLGSGFEADDAVQETMIRAWRNRDQFEGRSSLRSWMYKIATNVCLTSLDGRQRRPRPMDLGPSTNHETPVGPKREEIPWLEPIADVRAIPASADPAEKVVLRDTIRLAFVSALQNLPARQRAVLILCEVLRWKSEEVATLLETSVASVNSALQRARATLDARKKTGAETEVPTAEQEAIVDKWVSSFEKYDMDALASLLHEDVVMSMPPFELWLEGPHNVLGWLTGHGHGCEGSRLVATRANGAPAFGQYRVDPNGGHMPWALQVLDIADGKVVGLNSFLDTPQLFPVFGLPAHLD